MTLGQLREVPVSRRAAVLVRDVALPLSSVARCTPSDAVVDLLPQVTRESGRRALVFDGGHLVGIVTPADVTRALEARALLASTGK